MSIGENIKSIREAAKLTQEQLAERLYITRSTLSGYENDKHINLNMVMRICDALHTDPNHLFGVVDKSMTKDEFMKVGLKKLEEMYDELK